MSRTVFGFKPILFLTLALILALAAACSSGDDDTTTTSTSGTTTEPAAPAAAQAAPTAAPAVITSVGTPVAAAAPIAASGLVMAEPVQAKITRVVFGLTAPQVENFTPAKNGPPDGQPLTPMYEYLVGMDPLTGQLIPQLATGWEVDADGKSWRFFLREDVQFHGGWGEFTGKDVLHTWQQIAADDSQHGNHTSFARFVTDVEIINDHEVVVRAPSPTADLFILTSQLSQSLLIQSKDHRDATGIPNLTMQPTAGTGPYQFKENSSGSFFRYERTPYTHWRMTPDFQELEIRFMAEISTRVAGMLAGEIHLASIPEDNKEILIKGGMKIVSGNVPGLRTFMAFRCCVRNPATLETRNQFPPYDETMRYPDAPMQDVRVRQAINIAIDRNLLNQSSFGGKGETMYLNSFHPTREAWNPSWEARFEEFYGYDPAKARSLLAEAGYSESNPYEVELELINLVHYGGSLDVVEGVAGFLRDAGMKTKLITQDAATRRARSRAFSESNRLVITGTSSHILLGIRVYAAASAPRTGNPEFPDQDKLFVDIRGTLDAAQQAIWLNEFGELSYTRYQTVPLFWLPPEAMVNPEIVSDYIFPGAITSTWTHLEFIKAAQ